MVYTLKVPPQPRIVVVRPPAFLGVLVPGQGTGAFASLGKQIIPDLACQQRVIVDQQSHVLAGAEQLAFGVYLQPAVPILRLVIFHRRESLHGMLEIFLG